MRRHLYIVLLALASLRAADEPAGAAIYRQRCGVCHDTPATGSRVPPKATLESLRSATIIKVLESGVMKEQAKGLSHSDIRSLASWLSKAASDTVARANIANRCPADLKWIRKGAAWQGWGGPTNSRFQPDSAITAANIGNLRVKWAFGFPDATAVRAQPVVTGNRVFVGSADGTVYSLDTSTGCVHWAVEVAAMVRTAVAIGEAGGRTMALVGDSAGFLYGFDAESGELKWKFRPEKHPVALITGAPAIYAGRAYFGVSSYEEDSAMTAGYACCTFRGSVNAIDAATGKVLWKTYTVHDEPKPRPDTKRGNKAVGPSGAGVWSSPTVDAARRLIYVTTGDNYSDPPTTTSDAVLALEMGSGEIAWVKQMTTGDAYNSSCTRPGKLNCPDSDGPDHDLGASPILAELGGGRQALILSQKSGMVHAVDPARQGEILWTARVGAGGPLGGIQWGPAADSQNVYVALSDIRFKASKVLDREQGGGMFAVRLTSGEIVWKKPHPGCTDPRPCSPAQSAAVSMAPGIVFSGAWTGICEGMQRRAGRSCGITIRRGRSRR